MLASEIRREATCVASILFIQSLGWHPVNGRQVVVENHPLVADATDDSRNVTDGDPESYIRLLERAAGLVGLALARFCSASNRADGRPQAESPPQSWELAAFLEERVKAGGGLVSNDKLPGNRDHPEGVYWPDPATVLLMSPPPFRRPLGARPG